ncbi:MAG: response regulator [Chthoniobacterales bacterium]
MSEPQTPRNNAPPHALPSALLHELRTPLNHIIGFSELLLEQPDKNLVPDLQKIHTAGRQLLSLIDENFHSPGSSAPPAAPQGTSPDEPAAEGSANDPAAGQLASGAAKGFVLVVDDIEANRDVLSRHLQRQGYQVATAADGQQALEKLRAETFDLVLLDVMMPEMDGYEVLQRLKADHALRHLPVIMISAGSELESVVRCIEWGAEDYLSKPFDPTLLKARIGACLEKKRARDSEQALDVALHAQNRAMATWRKAQEADLAIARTTQQAIVTSALPALESWEVETLYTPLIQVGGDVYGWRQLENGSALFWVADATGHGIRCFGSSGRRIEGSLNVDAPNPSSARARVNVSF